VLLPLAAIGLALGSSGCGSGTSTASQSLVKTFNAYVPAAGATGNAAQITLFAGPLYLGAQIPFGTAGSLGSYVSVVSGTYNLYASVPGASSYAASLASQTFAGNNTAYTVVAAGQSGQTTGTYVPQVIVLPAYTANQLSLPSNTVAVRILNVSLNANPLGLFGTATGNPSTAVATATASIPYGYSASQNPYVAIPTASLVNMAIVDATVPKTALVLASSSNLNTNTFIAGDAYTLIIYGQASNGTLGVLWIQDYPTS